ncbi:preprotein translocase subunit YajC [Leadbettera azotonutricia]|uniref:Sec translocon accessory complex subunit YajC n=1 Tax=Leadbettera azotonutricia (strain ATCC BAA-888 / DSM 13862 / ZAS-9) TaxID=545695 RepID=F5Y8E4_LEAAZ|nr:preprotein translocase subunit YajC [Leadbettera azotonutricia]AEF80446.1 preprotein translocase, YajC subunit [Leadbettera azotonutricia ZAS-9]
MNSFVFSLLLGAPQGAEGAAPGGGLINFLPLVAIIGIFYFLIIRPQNKKQKETQKMLSALKKGDRIVTIGGIHGSIQSVKESTVIVRVDDNIKLEFSRSAISSVESQAKEEKEDKKIEAPAEDESDAEEKSE